MREHVLIALGVMLGLVLTRRPLDAQGFVLMAVDAAMVLFVMVRFL